MLGVKRSEPPGRAAQALIEYVVIIALIAISLITVLGGVANAVGGKFNEVAEVLDSTASDTDKTTGGGGTSGGDGTEGAKPEVKPDGSDGEDDSEGVHVYDTSNGDYVFAIYSADDNSVRIYGSTDGVPATGSEYRGRTVTAIDRDISKLDGFTDEQYAATVEIVCEDEVEFPKKSMDCWVRVSTYKSSSDFKNVTSIDFSKLHTSRVTDMSSMFYGCDSLTTLDVSGFDTSNVTDMDWMFAHCGSLTSVNVSVFDTSNVTDMSYMFYNCRSLAAFDVGGFDTSSVTDMQGMFLDCRSMVSIDVGDWDVSNVTDMSSMFGYCSKLVDIDVSRWDVSSVKSFGEKISGSSRWGIAPRAYAYYANGVGKSSWNCQGLSGGGDGTFQNCTSLVSLDVSKWDTSAAQHMTMMFYNCTSLASLDVTGWDTSNVTDFAYMFSGCNNESLELDIRNFDFSSAEAMSLMFGNWYLSSADTTVRDGIKVDQSKFGAAVARIIETNPLDALYVVPPAWYKTFIGREVTDDYGIIALDTSAATRVSDANSSPVLGFTTAVGGSSKSGFEISNLLRQSAEQEAKFAQYVPKGTYSLTFSSSDYQVNGGVSTITVNAGQTTTIVVADA